MSVAGAHQPCCTLKYDQQLLTVLYDRPILTKGKIIFYFFAVIGIVLSIVDKKQN